MKLTFRIEYRTAWGEELGVILDGNNSEPIILRTPNGEHWEGEAEMPDLPACVPVSYRYGVYRDGQCIRRESGTMAHLFCPGKKKNCHYILNDFCVKTFRLNLTYTVPPSVVIISLRQL